MALSDKTIKLCNCNRTLALDAKALAAALKLKAPLTIHTELCRKEVGAFNAALGEPELLVACTQEAPLFSELAQVAGAKGTLGFLNIRENAGWSAEGAAATPKIAALLAMAALPDPEPVPTVGYKSSGNLLIVGPAAASLAWAERLAGTLEVGVLINEEPRAADGAELPAERKYPVWSGKVTRLTGYLGAFELEWTQRNPIDLEVCTRCNACVGACPEQAIGLGYQIDLAKCTGHRACVKACGAVGAIDFERADAARTETFDMVLDLSREPLLKQPDLPQGYFAPGADPLEQALAAQKLPQFVGEFEKPRFFAYKERICAHSRSARPGCSKCIDVCSTGAISSDGDRVKIDPHLCAGCGGCSTVCPTGAMTYAYPRVPDTGTRIKTLLAAYREAGGKDACLLLHNAEAGRALVQTLGRRAATGGKGLPARVIPLEAFHIASIGMDVWLGAIAYGASQVVVVSGGGEPQGYIEALRAQMGIAQAILSGLGYAGTHLDLVVTGEPRELETALWSAVPAQGVARAATFNLSAEKRTTLDFAIDHLARHAPAPQEQIALGAGAPFGRIEVNKDACTLCKACIGACPAAALLDAPDAPRLRFIERNCVQCGLCASTCPESAISLAPRLLLTAQAKEAVTLNEAQVFECVRCAKPFGTKQMIDAMLGRLNAHSMFSGGGALRRLQMCADCRVIDMMENKDEQSILNLPRRT